MAEGLDVMAFGAHPDDADAACGGLLLKMARRGDRVGICDLTRGEMASNGTPEERAREADAAGRILGLAERLNLGLPDGRLCGDDAAQLLAIIRLLRSHRPRLIIGPHQTSRHPDHAATTALLGKAQFFCAVHGYDVTTGAVPRPVLLRALDFYPMQQPAFVVDIEAELQDKLRALACYVSQFERQPGRVATLLNSSTYRQRVETNARSYGQLIGSAAGEPYALDGTVRLDDPLRALTAGDAEVRA